MQRLTVLITLVLLYSSHAFGQTPAEVPKEQTLQEISVSGQRENIQRLPATSGTYLWSGKKNEVIDLQSTDANIAEKSPRQVFAKVPGVFVYDMDGTGNQVNISTRGLDPHRGWEFNIRTDGIMTNSDAYGYPASHFTLPFEAVGRIELVRGTGALQYGAQFGGMLNYVLKQPDTTRRFNFETVNSAGSFGLVSTYNAVGGKLGKVQYYAYYSQRESNGYRDNSKSHFDGQGLVLKYQPTSKFSLRAELLRSRYRYQTPGPLTDAMFAADPRQATRTRNYFTPEIYLPSLSAEWQVAPRTLLSLTTSAVLGQRSVALYDRPANIRDSINSATLAYNPRQIDIDNFHSYTTELRLLQQYSLLGYTSALTAGIQYMHNDLHRRHTPNGGTTGTDYDLTISAAGWRRDLHFKTQNIAIFLENKFQLSQKFSISPGFRYESGESKMSGTTTYLSDAELPNTIEHRFPLFGLNTEYVIDSRQNIYGGVSQAYRPAIFKDIIPGNAYERADKNLKDANGYTVELGWRGSTSSFKWDVSGFIMQYNNRLGSLAQYEGELDTFVLYRTNIGDSRTNGLEVFLEYGFHIADHTRLSIFTSTAYFDAKYQGDSVRISARENQSIAGKRVESVPQWISRNGVNFKCKGLSVSLLYSYTAESFADPLNTVTPSANGAVGLVPAYGLLDLNMSYHASARLMFRLNLSNLTDAQYFTKRPTFYPGPGVWPSDGRSINASVGLNF